MLLRLDFVLHAHNNAAHSASLKTSRTRVLGPTRCAIAASPAAVVPKLSASAATSAPLELPRHLPVESMKLSLEFWRVHRRIVGDAFHTIVGAALLTAAPFSLWRYPLTVRLSASGRAGSPLGGRSESLKEGSFREACAFRGIVSTDFTAS